MSWFALIITRRGFCGSIRPGDYYAIAFTGPELPWYAVLSDANLHKRSTSVTVSAGETATADLKVIAQ